MHKTAEQILKELTLEQKLAQLVAHGSPCDFVCGKDFNVELARERYPNGVFGIMAPIDLEPEEIGAWACQMLDYFKTVTPVPPILMCESLHGVLSKGTTVFPQSIGMGASFDFDLMRRVGDAIGKEARAMGIRMSLAPDLDLGREPRWGRTEETYGEDSYLVGMMGEAYVKGLIGEDKKYAATVKHFAAHGMPRAGINLSGVTVTEQELRDRYLPPFKKALDAGAYCVMPAYSTLNGVPCHASTHLMNDILRGELGFDGVVISDFGGIAMLTYFQHMAQDKEEAALLSVDCGVDVEAPDDWAYGKPLKSLVEDGWVDIAEIDRMVLRVLKLKEKLGIFDLPRPDIDEIKKTVRSPEHKALAREAAEKTIMLLKNNGALPLKNGAKIAVIGPNATSVQLGDYALPKLDAKTPLEAIRERAELTGGAVGYAHGCDVYGADKSDFEEALTLARDSDVVVCIIGGKSMKGYGVGWGSEEESILTCGEGCDMHDLTPGGPQLDLVRELIKTGKDVVVVMVDGRPETLHDVTDECSALVGAWYPGEEGSVALASLLFGDKNFSAKTPVTFPKHTGQLPMCYDYLASDYGFYHCPGTVEKPGRDYVFCDTEPKFPFGYGIGYSPVAYSNLAVKWENGEIKASVTVENQGKMTTDEPVLLFVTDEVSSFPQPIKKLLAVSRVTLAPGEQKTVNLTVSKSALEFTDQRMQKRFESGWFTVSISNLAERIYIED